MIGKLMSMNRILYMTVFLLFACSSPAREEQPALKTEPLRTESLQGFILKGYTLTDSFHVDMNQDNIEDLVLVMKADTNSAEGKDVDEAAVCMMILCREKNGDLKEAARNEYFLSGVPCNALGTGSYYYPDLVMNSDGSFGYNKFFYHCGEEHSESSILFRYSKEKKDWFLDSYLRDNTSDKPVPAGGYDDNTGSFNKSARDFGEIRFADFDGLVDFKIHFPDEK